MQREMPRWYFGAGAALHRFAQGRPAPGSPIDKGNLPFIMDTMIPAS